MLHLRCQARENRALQWCREENWEYGMGFGVCETRYAWIRWEIYTGHLPIQPNIALSCNSPYFIGGPLVFSVLASSN